MQANLRVRAWEKSEKNMCDLISWVLTLYPYHKTTFFEADAS